MKKTILLFVLVMFLSSCAIQGLTNDYKKLTSEQQNSIVALNSFDSATDLDIIYKVNGFQLRKELKKYPKVLVYVLTNGCISEYCKPLYIYENYAKENNYKLFLVMDGYGNLSESTKEVLNVPLFSIDNEYYDKKMRGTCTRYFENDMLGRDLKYKEKSYLGNLFFFENGELVSISRELPEQQQSFIK